MRKSIVQREDGQTEVSAQTALGCMLRQITAHGLHLEEEADELNVSSLFINSSFLAVNRLQS